MFDGTINVNDNARVVRTLSHATLNKYIYERIMNRQVHICSTPERNIKFAHSASRRPQERI